MSIYDEVLRTAIVACVEVSVPDNQREAVATYAEQIRRILAAGGKPAYIALACIESAIAAAEEMPDEVELPTIDVEGSIRAQLERQIADFDKKAGQ